MKIYAYLDPGSGTLIVQALLGGLGGVAVLFKTLRRRIGRRPRRDDARADPQPLNGDEASSSAPPKPDR